jgi:hypothetical protein
MGFQAYGLDDPAVAGADTPLRAKEMNIGTCPLRPDRCRPQPPLNAAVAEWRERVPAGEVADSDEHYTCGVPSGASALNPM